MRLGLETFSYHLAFGRKKMDTFGFIDRAHALGLDGVQINIGPGAPGWGHLGSVDAGYLREVRTTVEDLGMYIEIDTRGTDPGFLVEMLGICKALGADVLRIYASVGGNLEQELAQAPGHFRQVLPVCEDYGVRIAFENHEYETSQDVLKVIREVDSPYVGALVDTGNSMMVWEDPVEAVRAMAPCAVSSHFKDHVVYVDDGQPLVAGVTLGKGSIDCAACFRILAEASPLERINIEVCYDYRAPFRRPQSHGAGATLGQGAFRVLAPPFEPSYIAPPTHKRSALEDERLPEWQDQAVVESVAFVKGLNEQLGSDAAV